MVISLKNILKFVKKDKKIKPLVKPNENIILFLQKQLNPKKTTSIPNYKTETD